MKASDKIIQFIANIEQYRADAYRPTPEDRWTIGYGTTYWEGAPVHSGEYMNEETAMEILAQQVQETAMDLSKAQIPLSVTQNQFDAVVSLAYNIGVTAWINSNTAKLFYAGENISDRLLKFRTQRGKVLAGLVIRREKEKKIYDSADYGETT